MSITNDSLWTLARSGQPIDAAELASAIESETDEEAPDFRTRLLIRDALEALAAHWGEGRLTDWLSRSAREQRLRRIWRSSLGPAGFPTLRQRIMDATRPDTVLQFFRDLGSRLSAPARLEVGESTALILAGILSRQTDDIDVVDEVPPEIRVQYSLLDELAKRDGLTLAHFQSHFLPAGWSNRLRSLGRFGQLDVFLVDACDVLAGKLFSTRNKDLDDLRAASPGVDKHLLESRLRQSCGPLLGDPVRAETGGETGISSMGNRFRRNAGWFRVGVASSYGAAIGAVHGTWCEVRRSWHVIQLTRSPRW